MMIRIKCRVYLSLVLVVCTVGNVSAWGTTVAAPSLSIRNANNHNNIAATAMVASKGTTRKAVQNEELSQENVSAIKETNGELSPTTSRRALLWSSVAAVAFTSMAAVAADDSEEESFASIRAKASSLSKQVNAQDQTIQLQKNTDGRTAYDFTLPVAGEPVPFETLIHQTFKEATVEEGGVGGRIGTVKAILVVNIKQDDPVARKDIAELIEMASKYGRTGEFVVVCSPTDQGYYEPDTSALIRLKMASEYGYGINPATVLTDKMNLLGTGAHPFWRWLEGNCRTPLGLGKIQANFEKFLVDGQTGLPIRRYPRKYSPNDIKEDIQALIIGRPLPPAGANYMEEWRSANVEAERDTYRFQKGLNVFDQ